MRNLLPRIHYIIPLILVFYLPQSIKAQCSCSLGATPDSIVQSQYFDSITSVNTSVVFNQFDPSIGMLTCFKLTSNVTTVLNFDLTNKEGFMDRYEFESFRRSRFTGPNGFSKSVNSPAKNYGPYDLEAYDPVGTDDEVHVGPDTVFNNKRDSSYHSGGGGYLGTGTVTFDYLNTSTTTLLDGSSNYDLFVRGYTRMNVKLVYYYCPASLLATNIRNFVALKANGNVNLSWMVDNEENGNTYDVLLSYDGQQYASISTQTASHQMGNSTKYLHSFTPGQAGSGKVYLRIRKTDASGKLSYSSIRTINLDKNSPAGFIVYPNPVVNRVAFQFDSNLSGNYRVEFSNQVGQVVHAESFQLKNQNYIQFNLKNSTAPGIYYIRIRDDKNTETYTGKVMIKR